MPRQTFHDDLSLKRIIFDQDDLSVAIHAELSFALPAMGFKSRAAYTGRGDFGYEPYAISDRGLIRLFPSR
jgi:hypothetical protein